jgi:hypothetical protein
MDETELSDLADAALTEVRTRAHRQTDLAWSQGEQEEPAEYIERRRTTVVLWTFVAVAALAVAALAGVWLTNRSMEAPTAAPTVQNPGTVLPSPEDVIVPTVAPKPVTPPPYTAADDQRFLHRLKELGATLYKPQLVLETAHMTCDQFRAGKTTTQVQGELAVALGDVTEDTVEQFASSVQMVYPHCG